MAILPDIEAYPERSSHGLTDWDARILKFFSRLDPRQSLRRPWGADHAFVKAVRAEIARLGAASPDPARLTEKALRLKRFARQGRVKHAPLAAVLAEICLAAERKLGQSPFDVQILSVRILFDGEIAEMGTGEGKSLSGALAAAALALSGRRVHVMTVNDYLAARDAEYFKAFFAELGLSVACVTGETAPDGRTALYRSDIVFSAAKNIVFDYLRDITGPIGPVLRGTPRKLLSLKASRQGPVDSLLQGLDAVIIDEADSVMIDQAATPFILSGGEAALGGLDVDTLRLALQAAAQLDEEIDFLKSEALRRITITDPGRERLAMIGQGAQGLFAVAPVREHLVTQALVALHMLERNRDYLVTEKGVAIIDESTGRLMPDRQWSEGLHQLVELKEDLEPSDIRTTIGRITFQRFFPRYRHLCGMTGTATSAARELWEVYGLRVRRILPRKPDIRLWHSVRIFESTAAKWQAVAALTAKLQVQGAPVLIGTRTLRASRHCSEALAALGIEHEILSADHAAEEASIIREAGQTGRVTVATNMAGRGTDILLSDAARNAGGLQVVLTELHGNERIDRQLCGRCGRQGDPGAVYRYFSLEDDIIVSEARSLQGVTKGINRAGGPKLAFVAMRLIQALQSRRAEAGRASLAMRERLREKQLALSGRLE